MIYLMSLFSTHKDERDDYDDDDGLKGTDERRLLYTIFMMDLDHVTNLLTFHS